MVGWSGTAHELILVNLLNEFEKDPSKVPTILDQKTTKVGMSFQAHKKFQNVFQMLLVKSASNTIEWEAFIWRGSKNS